MSRRFAPVVVAIICAVSSAACGGSAPQQTPPPAATGTPSPADAAAQAAQAMQQTAQALQQAGQQTAKAVEFEQLIALLPEVSGWTRSKPKGEQVSMGVTMSHAKAEYQKGEASIDLDITDSSFNQLVLSPFTMFLAAGYSERTSDGYRKSAAMGGYPGFEEWNNEAKTGKVIVVVGNRFVVAADGRGLDDIDAVKALVKTVNLGALTTLK